MSKRKRRHESEMIRAAGNEPSSLIFDAPVQLQAAAGENKLPTFKISAYTGSVMKISGFYSPVIIDLSGMKAARAKLPILLNHDSDRIIGQADKIDIGPEGVALSGVITGNDADAQSVVTHAKNGFEWQASVGASIDSREIVDAGKTARVNGHEVTGPMMIARKSTLSETSFVAIGADGNTAAKVAAKQHSNPNSERSTTMNEFEKWLKAKNIDAATLEDGPIKAALKAQFDAEQTASAEAKAAAAKPEVAAKARGGGFGGTMKEIKAENERVAGLEALGLDYARKCPSQLDMIQAAVDRAVEDHTTVQDLELSLLRDCRATAPNTRIGRGNNREPDAQTITAAICMMGQLNDIEKKFKPEVLEAAHQQWPHGLGLDQVLTIFAKRNGFGGHTAKSSIETALRAAFYQNPSHLQASGFSTLSLPGILSNVANKYLLEGYNGVEQTWREVASVRPVQDFKTVTGYRMTGAFEFKKIGPDGELKHGEVGEQSFTNKAETYGTMFSITRTNIINDDLGALTAVPRRIGRGGALRLNLEFWTEWLENAGNFWHTSNNNIISGATTNLSAVGLQAAITKFAKLTDPDGKPLATMADRLLVPPEIKFTADQLYASANFNTGGSATTAQVPAANTYQNKYRPIQSTYLSNTAITGNSTTAFWLLGNPADISAIEVVFLNGVQQPTVESADADFNVLGIQMRGYWDFGVNKQDPRAGVKSAGV